MFHLAAVEKVFLHGCEMKCVSWPGTRLKLFLYLLIIPLIVIKVEVSPTLWLTSGSEVLDLITFLCTLKDLDSEIL